MREYFFERVRPIVEKALHEGNHGDWPLITLNLDLKSEEPEHLAAIWQLLAQYQDWLTTAHRTGTIDRMETLEVRPVLVLTGESDAQKAVFYDQVAEGESCSYSEPCAPTRMTPPRRLKGWRRIPPTTITAGGTIVGASLSPKASPKQVTGLWKKNRVSASSFATRMATTCGFAFTRLMGPPNRSSVAMAGSAPTTLVQGKRSANAGRPLPNWAWITSHRISTKNWAPYSNPSGRTAPRQNQIRSVVGLPSAPLDWGPKPTLYLG